MKLQSLIKYSYAWNCVNNPTWKVSTFQRTEPQDVQDIQDVRMNTPAPSSSGGSSASGSPPNFMETQHEMALPLSGGLLPSEVGDIHT